MSISGKRVLTSEQMDAYQEFGFVHSVPILPPEEVRYYRDHLERSWSALGGRVTRADGLHLFFRWAWDLATHPRLLDCLEDLLGPVILLRHTRIFYKYGQSAAWVNWHQDGYTEHLSDAQVPAIWLGLTDATVENGCLRVVPRSHHLGMQSHWSRQTHDGLATSSLSDREPGSAAGDDHDLSGKATKLAEGLDAPFDVVMKAGEMSFHHPLALHGSNPNASAKPRIGLSATYCTPGLHSNGAPVALVRGSVGPQPGFLLSSKPADLPLEEAVAAYRASHHQLLFALS
jgi:ectoine hydroxylase-related dioxygenase (phytanoyl-CoA dioxygenase family)